MDIAQGFDDKRTSIRVSAETNGTIHLWIEQTGLEEDNRGRETLSYMTADELLRLYREVQQAGRDLFC